MKRTGSQAASGTRRYSPAGALVDDRGADDLGEVVFAGGAGLNFPAG